MDWLPLAGIALLTTAFVISIAYMIAKGFHLPQLEGWAKLEYHELLVSALLLGAIVFGIGMIDVVAGQLGQGKDMTFQVSADPANADSAPAEPLDPSDPLSDPVYVSKATCTFGGGSTSAFALERTYAFDECYLEKSADHMIYVYRQLSKANRYISKMTTFSYNIAIPLYLFSASVYKAPHAGLSYLPGLIGGGMDALASSIFIQVSQKLLLDFFHAVSFSWILPFGLALRSFTFSRKLGATLIAIAIGTYVVYPLTIAFAAGVYDAPGMVKDISINLPNEPPNLQDTAICSPFVQNFMWVGSITWWFVWFTPECTGTTFLGYLECMLAVYPEAQSIFNGINAVFLLAYAPTLWDYAFKVHPEALYNLLADPTNPQAILPAVSHNAMITAVLSVFSIILTVSATRSLSMQLGGDVQFYGIYKLI
ncbi:MAG: hypothetical protein Q7T16_01665 [Candidatus Burarchaeum sp.]|nr:hypothetical protein [Candidatus Burarchaeum sp.]MDO8339342.1 hypothetical protein [Candidatus Burarchaeum sp.]